MCILITILLLFFSSFTKSFVCEYEISENHKIEKKLYANCTRSSCGDASRRAFISEKGDAHKSNLKRIKHKVH